MNLRTLLTPLLVGALCMTLSAAEEYNFQFSSSSVLATGKWVRVRTSGEGIYSITYDQLRAMGFDHPERVSVRGYGGEMLSDVFHDIYKRPVYFDNPPETAVLHRNNTLFFHATEKAKIDMTFRTIPIKFTRYDDGSYGMGNIYTDYASYYLTDTGSPLAPGAPEATEAEGSVHVPYGFDYIYHEEDRFWRGMSRIIWGEDLSLGAKVSFEYDLPYAYLGTDLGGNTIKHRLDYGYAFQTGQDNCMVRSTVNGASALIQNSGRGSKVWTHYNQSGRIKEDCKLKIDFQCEGQNMFKWTALDYFTFSYPKTFEGKDLSGFVQERMAIVPSTSGTSWFEIPEGCVVWDVTDKNNILGVMVDGNKAYSSGTAAKRMVVFDPSKPQKQIEAEVTQIENQNLHAWQDEPFEFLIISTTPMLSYSRQIAALHEKHDGIRARVVTPEEIYREFSGGQPDVTGIRAFVKMLWQSQGALRNILMVGPIYGDYKNVCNGRAPRQEGLIGCQVAGNPDFKEESGNNMDYYAVVPDNLHADEPHNYKAVAPVGILPVCTQQEAELAVSKIKRFLEEPDYSRMVNETVTMTCEGDYWLHDYQGLQCQSTFQTLAREHNGSRFSHTNLITEWHGKSETARLLTQALNEGPLWAGYYGHSNRSGIAGVFSTDQFTNMQNSHLGWFMLAGCDSYAADRGETGVADAGVLRARNGFVGSIAASRQVVANLNYDLSVAIIKGMFWHRDRQTKRTESPTIGECYHYGKWWANSATGSCYNLIGDPALRVPVPLATVTMDTLDKAVAAGETAVIRGRVLTPDSVIDTAYNGFVTLKLMAPAIVKVHGGLTNDKYTQLVPYDNMRLGMWKAKVTDGKFEVRISVPDECAGYRNESLDLLAGVYNPATRNGGSGVVKLLVDGIPAEGTEIERDTEAPAVALAYNNETRTLRVEATDNNGLRPGIGAGSGLRLVVDGNDLARPDGESELLLSSFYSGEVSVAYLKAGEHTAYLTAVDGAGNAAEPITYKFTIEEGLPFVLTASGKLAIEGMDFTLDRDADGCTLVVFDPDGKLVAREDCTGKMAGVDTEGWKPGIYRAAVRHESAAGAEMLSNWVEFVKID